MRTGVGLVTSPHAALVVNPLLVNLVYIVLVVVGFWLAAKARRRVPRPGVIPKRRMMSSRRLRETHLVRSAASHYRWFVSGALFLLAVLASSLAGVGELPDAALGWTLLLHVERAALLACSLIVVVLLLRALLGRTRQPRSGRNLVAALRALLVVVGIGAISAAVALRTVGFETSKVIETTETRGIDPSPRGARPFTPTRATKGSSTTAPLSETVMVSLIGIGAVLLLVGVLYYRIPMLPTPFGEIPLAPEPQSLPPSGPATRVPAVKAEGMAVGGAPAALEPLLTQEAYARFDLVEVQRQLPGKREVRVAILGAGIDPELAINPVFGARVERPTQLPDARGAVGVMTAQVGIVAALAPTARILPVGVIPAVAGSDPEIATGLRLAHLWNADIVLLDFGFFGDVEEARHKNRSLVTYLERGRSQGILITAPAGNEATPEPGFPASEPEVAACAALDPDDHLAEFSSRGGLLAAPGGRGHVECLTGIESGQLILEPRGGTSVAAGFITAFAALLLASDESLEPKAARSLLYDHGFPVEDGGLTRGIDPKATVSAVQMSAA